MAVPGRIVGPPADIAETDLFAVDAYRTTFDARVEEVEREAGRVALSRTAFYPGGGGQPNDLGVFDLPNGTARVAKVKRDGARIWHWLDTPELPDIGDEVCGHVDWDRRYLLMRTHTALHILCGVVWSEFRVPVTGGNMDPGSGRLDFPLESMSGDLGRRLEQRMNEEIAAAREILIEFVGRSDADHDDALIRTSANLIPAEIDPLRVITIVGLDKQADGGTHVFNTARVGSVRVTRTESKGRVNKRVRLEVGPAASGADA